jgi:hypothetical protein
MTMSGKDPLDCPTPRLRDASTDHPPLTASGRRRAATIAFRSRLEAGDFRELFGGRLGELMTQAAEEAGVTQELGALRIVMARLMEEEDDLIELAPLIARIASVSIQAARVQRAISGQLAESLTEALTSILAEMNGSDE